MPTKDELEAALEAEKRSSASLRGQITKLQNQLASGETESLADDFVEAVRTLLEAIDAKSVANQIGNHKEVSNVRRLLQ